MRTYLIPFAPVRIDPDTCLRHARTCYWLNKRGYQHCEHLMWEWLLRWAGAPV